MTVMICKLWLLLITTMNSMYEIQILTSILYLNCSKNFIIIIVSDFFIYPLMEIPDIRSNHRSCCRDHRKVIPPIWTWSIINMTNHLNAWKRCENTISERSNESNIPGCPCSIWGRQPERHLKALYSALLFNEWHAKDCKTIM